MISDDGVMVVFIATLYYEVHHECITLQNIYVYYSLLVQ